MVHNSQERLLFPVLPVDTIHELCHQGEEIEFGDGSVLMSEGEPDYSFFIILEGTVQVSKKNGTSNEILTTHQAGEFTGELSMIAGTPAVATAIARGKVRALRFSNGQFRRMIAECPEVAKPILIGLAARSREVDSFIMQQQKLAALGKLSAGLAHELNNPAAAMVRSAQSMRSAVHRIAALGLQYDCRFTSEQRPVIEQLQKHIREEALDPETLSPLERSDREEALAEWLEENGIENAWEMAPGLISAGMTRECIDDIDNKLPAPILAAALTWFEADLTTNQLTMELEASACRISDLVKAMKQYTYMDQAQFQDVDIHTGLDSTLKIFAHKMRAAIEVRRDYDRSLPKICAYPGELNQVWTNLISNAIDAMNGSGVLSVKTRREGEFVVVSIADSGPGIPEAVREKMFDPFFTTKAAGKGTGLGLEITKRIVINRHNGKIEVQSEPGNTRFDISLPINRRKDDAVYTH